MPVPRTHAHARAHTHAQVGSLDIKIEADCQASECIDPEGPVLVGEAVARAKGRDWLHPVVAAIPGMLLFVGAAACGLMMAGARGGGLRGGRRRRRRWL